MAFLDVNALATETPRFIDTSESSPTFRSKRLTLLDLGHLRGTRQKLVDGREPPALELSDRIRRHASFGPTVDLFDLGSRHVVVTLDHCQLEANKGNETWGWQGRFHLVTTQNQNLIYRYERMQL